MPLLLAALCLILAGGLAALAAFKSPRWATLFGVGGALAGCLAGLVPALRVVLGGATETVRIPWQIPFGAFYVELDALSAFFLLAILSVGAASALFGSAYLQSYRATKSLGPPWFFFNLAIVAISMVVVARNAVLFLMAWEIMALASYFLVTFEGEKKSARDAGWTYLIATHLGTSFLVPMFLLLGRESGSLDFDHFTVGRASLPVTGTSGVLFIMALIGFGTKAGIMPLHVWLPEAHPAAPSHVSALMSAVIIKTGIYGIVRTLTFLGTPEPWWGWVLIGLGLSSGILGVLYALAQHDLKRLLAYHSVENIGIICLGLGIGVLGLSSGSPVLAVLGLGGGLLHVLNHALFKGLLFLGAGAVAHATGTREMDALGGLLKKMPVTGLTFLIGAVAICGLPPLNGFVSEFLIYLAAFHGNVSEKAAQPGVLLLAIAGLALIGGLAAACFTKAFGAVFLGHERSAHASGAHEAGVAMCLPMIFLSCACAAIGLGSPFVVVALGNVIRPLTAPLELLTIAATGDGQGRPSYQPESTLALAVQPLSMVVLAALALAGLSILLVLLRRALLKNRPVQEALTWDCGYARPSARMQYTASSFAQPLVSLFHLFLGTRQSAQPPRGLFPKEASLATETPDAARERFFDPLFRGIRWGIYCLRWLQHGRVHLYVLYVALTVLVLLVWKLG